jgi:hypothetical protein
VSLTCFRTFSLKICWHVFPDPGVCDLLRSQAIALFLGIRDGARDARGGSPPFLVALAILVDVISQVLIFRDIHPAAALLLGPMLIALPYATSRGLANRFARKGSQSRTRVELRRSQGGANEGNCRITARIVRTLPFNVGETRTNLDSAD